MTLITTRQDANKMYFEINNKGIDKHCHNFDKVLIIINRKKNYRKGIFVSFCV